MSCKDLFTRYGSPHTEADIRITGYLLRPDRLNNAKDIGWNDNTASRLIADCERLIESLKEYRQDLAKRYNELETMTYFERLTIERDPSRYGGITYYVRILRKYEDGTEIQVSSERFEGKERHKALKRYEDIKKQRPGIEAVKDIEKRYWEK